MSNYNNGNNSNNKGANYQKSYERDSIQTKSSDKGMIIAVAILTIVVAVSCAVLVIFVKKDNPEQQPENITVVDKKEPEKQPEKQPEKSSESAPEKIETTKMYIDCDTVAELKNGTGADDELVAEIPVGSEVEFYEYAENEYAKIEYDGREGYVESKYLSKTCPYVWYYEDSEVEDYVEDTLYGYVNSINTGDITYLTKYLSGEALVDAYANHKTVTSVVSGEEMISVNCHSATRISKTQVTVIRESEIKVYYYDGREKIAPEKYLTTLEKTSDEEEMKVIKFERME